ncbi:MAG: hypothetical protein ABEI53_03035 [Candidatus Magasanikbacteria bacterium]
MFLWTALIAGYLIYLVASTTGSFIISASTKDLMWPGIILGSILVILLLKFFWNKVAEFKSSEEYKLMKEFIKAKKEKVCPTIEFE